MRFYDHPGYIHPGIRTSDPRVNTRNYHVFYQWVSFVLFIQVTPFPVRPKILYRDRQKPCLFTFFHSLAQAENKYMGFWRSFLIFSSETKIDGTIHIFCVKFSS